MNVTSLRSTMQARRTSVRWFFCQHALNSCTQGSVSRPCRIHLSSAGVSLKLIFNMLFSSELVSEKSLCDRKDDCVDMRVISSSAPIFALVVLLLELAFRLQPVFQVAAMNSATLDVNLNRSLTNFCQRWPIVATFFRDV